jgi:hypothetical protein
MKKVFSSHNEVAHIWASRSQFEGRGGNIFFEDDVIYSYGRHFPVAKFGADGITVLFTDRGYSSSTGKHKSIIRGAIPCDYRVIYCDDPTRGPDHNLPIWARKVERLRADFAAKKLRVSRGNLAVEIFKTCESAVEYCLALKISEPDWTNELNDEMTARDYVYEMAKAREVKREAAKIEREKAAALGAIDRLQQWQCNLPFVSTDGFQYHPTRLRLKSDFIQTSRGANIPVADALKLWPLLVRVRESGKTMEAGLREIHLGAYRFNSFDGQTLIVGCHSIEWDQLALMAEQLNLLEKA